MPDMEVLLPLVVSVSGGFLLGFLVGYALKKMLKLAAVIAGVFLLGLIALDYTGIISVNYEALEKLLGGLASTLLGNNELLATLASNLPVSGGFVLGLIVGLKKG